MITYKSEVNKAIYDELKLCIDYQVMEKCLRSKANNTMTSRFVLKRKFVSDGRGGQVRTIRARMALRGFQDQGRFDVDTYAGTASRLAQRMLVSQCAVMVGWMLMTLDISKAFLQGMSYVEIANRTGEAQREVTFTLPRGADMILHQFPSYADYNETVYCLKCLKPGTGTVDAPKGLGMMLKEKLENDGPAWIATSVDLELYMRFHNGVLVGLIAAHVDDLKMCRLGVGVG